MSVTRMLITVSERILLIVPTLTDLIHVYVIQVTTYIYLCNTSNNMYMSMYIYVCVYLSPVKSTTASTLFMKTI